MKLNLDLVQQHFPDLLLPGSSLPGGMTAYRLQLPAFQPGREFDWVELRLPKGFPDDARALITLAPNAVLRVPHLDQAGVLCINGDPGPSVGLTPEDRVIHLLQAYQDEFLNPWLAGALDHDFETEALNYWAIEVASGRTDRDPVSQVWTVDPCPTHASLTRGLLLIPSNIVIAASENLPITRRLVESLGKGTSQEVGVLIADIPIPHSLTPSTWPRTTADVDQILLGRFAPEAYREFSCAAGRRGRQKHRIVLLRTSDVAFAYLLPGGPPTVVESGTRKKTYPPRKGLLPLIVHRVDPAWTVGRGQHPEVSRRQRKHVLVLGAGALGSPVIDHLAKAGVALITVVDTESLSSANIGRHLLGVESVGKRKVNAIAQRINMAYPASTVTPCVTTAEHWLKQHTLSGVDVVIDLTGEPDVRWFVNEARRKHPCPLVIGWMEPYVAAAHVCLLPATTQWIQDHKDSLTELEAITWPVDVLRREPGCSSFFQSYTAAAAAHAIALIAERALSVIDRADDAEAAQVVSWVRGQEYLDAHWPGLTLRDWARPASPFDGLILTRPFP